MSWTTPRQLREQLQKRWDRGQLLGSLLDETPLFPLKLSLKTPDSTALAAQFDAVRQWIATLRDLPHYRLEMREINHRVLGRNQLPVAVWVDSLADAAQLLGKGAELRRFEKLLHQTCTEQPTLLPWLSRRPLKTLELAPDWPRLLAVVGWLQQHPRPGVYLRQVDLPGVHSKFIEAHRGVLMELLDLALPPEAIDPRASGVTGFAQRYGFRDKPVRVRFRVLDPEVQLLPLQGQVEYALDAASFAQLDPPLARVFITENEVNFLAFPALPDSLVVFGAGYGFEELAQAGWLYDRDIYYWGDIDTHGFAILDQLRGFFPAVTSLLMDQETLMANQALWSQESKPSQRTLHRLTPQEQALYQDLKANCLGTGVRLEQERIGFQQVLSALYALPD